MLDSEAFPDSLVLSRENSLVIGQLEKLHELQIRTVRAVIFHGVLIFISRGRRSCSAMNAPSGLPMTLRAKCLE